MISTGSIIVADTSGQTIQKPYIRQEKNRVYITDDNKYIVVDEIKFEIYRPEHGVTIGPQESWYDVDSWVISQKDFDTVKALTGIGGALLGIGDITLPEQGEIKDKYNYVQQGAYPTTPRATKDYHIKTLAAFGFQFEIDILQAIADAIEYTYVKFCFQVSNSKKYRVVVLGGTKSDTIKYQNYLYYDIPRSYLKNIVPSNFEFITINAMKKDGYKIIEPLVTGIKEGKIKAEILVTDDQLKLTGDEYYDAHCRLSSERQYKEYQMYIYPNQEGRICQKLIVYAGEYLKIVKRQPAYLIYYGGKTVDLIEAINAAIIEDIDKDDSNLYWELFERALINHSNSKATSNSMEELCEKALLEN